MIGSRAPVAQRIEQVPSKHLVAGSIPAGRTISFSPGFCPSCRAPGVWHSAQSSDDFGPVRDTWESPIRDFVRHLEGTNRAVNTQIGLSDLGILTIIDVTSCTCVTPDRATTRSTYPGERRLHHSGRGSRPCPDLRTRALTCLPPSCRQVVNPRSLDPQPSAEGSCPSTQVH